MSTETVNWTITVSKETDLTVRRRLGRKGRSEDEFARFVERAVRKQMFADMLAASRARNAGTPDEELQKIVDEAVDSVRSEMRGTNQG